MPKIVDKEERKQMILQKALEVFARVGYREANFSLIAEACEISRPTVYQYFKDKTEIYYYAVKNVTQDMFSRYSAIAFDEAKGDELVRINLILSDIFQYAQSNSAAVANLVEFILQGKRDNEDVYEIIRSRTAKLRILLKRLILSGMNHGVIRDCDPDRTGEELFNLIQAVGFQIGFFENYTAEEGYKTVSDFMESYRRV